MIANCRRWLLALAATAVSSTQAQTPAASTAARALSLDDALALAEGTSPDVAIARAAVQRAEGQREKARAQFLPQLLGSASYTRTLKSQFQGLNTSSDTTAGPAACSTFVPDTLAPIDQRVRLLEQALGCSSGGFNFGSFQRVGFGAPNQYNLGLSLQQNLFTGGRVRAQYRASNAARESATIGLTAARAQLVLDVAQAYYDAQLSDRLVAIAQATLAQADTTLAQTRLARQVGNQPEFELLRAQVTRDNQVPVLIQRRSDREIAYTRLRQLLDLPQSQPLTLTTSLGDTTAPSARVASLLQTMPDTAAAHRAPVREATENVLASRSQLTVAHAQRLPAITLSSAFGRVAFPTGFPEWSQFRTNWTITAGLSIPLITWGSIHGDEQIAQANLREAQARLTQTRQLAELDARNAVNRLAAADAQWAASQGTVEQAVRAYSIAEVRYREGISTQTELNDSRILLQQAQANRAVASRDLQVARMRVALLRDLPLGTVSGQPATGGATTPTLTLPITPAQPTTPQQPAATAVNASQTGSTGVNP